MAGTRPLSKQEIDQVLSLLKTQRDKTLFILGLKSGFRISELLSIRVKDIIQNNRVVDKIRVTRSNMKANRTRDVILHPLAKEYILNLIHQDKLESHHYLFKSRKGDNKAITREQAWNILREAFDKAHLTGPLGTHSLRKTFSVSVHKALGNDLLATQKALGHSSINSTIAYLPINEEEVDNAILNL